MALPCGGCAVRTIVRVVLLCCVLCRLCCCCGCALSLKTGQGKVGEVVGDQVNDQVGRAGPGRSSAGQGFFRRKEQQQQPCFTFDEGKGEREPTDKQKLPRSPLPTTYYHHPHHTTTLRYYDTLPRYHQHPAQHLQCSKHHTHTIPSHLTPAHTLTHHTRGRAHTSHLETTQTAEEKSLLSFSFIIHHPSSLTRRSKK